MKRSSADAAGSGKQKNPSTPPDASAFDGEIPRDKSGKPVLTPEMIEELIPQSREIDRVRRKLLVFVTGCGGLVVLVLLALLYIPYWQMEADAQDVARHFLEAASQGDLEEATRYSGIQSEDYVRRQVTRFQAAIGENGSFVVEGLEYVSAEPNDQVYVIGELTPEDGDPVPFRLRVTWSAEHDDFAVYHGHIGDEAAQ